MITVIAKDRHLALLSLNLAALAVLGIFIWEGNKGFSLWDEGYLWYGVQRVIAGEVPIRDFMAYDPGRYYFVAALLAPWGDYGIMAVRVAVSVFQALGLSVGLLLIAKEVRVQGAARILYLGLAAVTLVFWMVPRHKLFDASISIFTVGMIVWLLHRPVGRRYLLAGIYTGLVAVFGRNHGVYASVGMLGAMGWLAMGPTAGYSPLRGLTLWVAGVAVGFSPVLIMAMTVSGFAKEFIDSVRFIFEFKGTNLPLPVPWPWRVPYSTLSIGEATRQLIVGASFIAIVAFGPLAAVWCVYKRWQGGPVAPILVASGLLALPYAHYSFSRADVNHLAQGIFPLLLGLLAFSTQAGRRIRWACLGMLCTASVWAILPAHPGWQCYGAGNCEALEVSGSRLLTDRGTAGDVALLRRLANQYAPGQRTFFATPFWPGAYALLERKSPIWEIYALFPRSGAYQEEQIRRLKAADPGFVVISNYALDGRDSLRFSNTHPLVYEYVNKNFDAIGGSLGPDYLIFKARDIYTP